MKDITLLEGVDIFMDMKTTVKGYKKEGVVYITKINRERIEKKKTLSDKINPCNQCDNDLRSKDVKEALKEYRKSLLDNFETLRMTQVNDKAKEIFGDRLV